MAVGASKALLVEQHAQSVFKHAILEQYLTRFIAKTGATAHPAVLVDGFAGTGRAGSGLGSAGLMLRAAKKMKARGSTRLYFVEEDTGRHAALEELTAAFRVGGVEAVARRGCIENELGAWVGSGTGGSG